MEAGAIVAFFFACVLGIFIWVMMMGMDKVRITEYLRSRGGRVVSINWAPFGKGWFGEKNDRIYEVVYYDDKGNQHFATCKTSMWGGVYWTDDRRSHRKSTWFDHLSASNEPGNPIIKQIDDDRENASHELFRDEPTAPNANMIERPPFESGSTDVKSQEPPASLVDEMWRLRAENERLRQELAKRHGA